MRRLAPVITSVFSAVVLIAAPAQAEGNGGWHHLSNDRNNNVQVMTSQNGEFRWDTGIDVTNNPSDTVDNQNFAFAEGSNCTGCRTIAVAVQVVIAGASPHTMAPQNAALAVNNNCQSCQTFAYAHQYVIQTSHPVWLSHDAREQAQEVQEHIDEVASSNEDFATMSNQLDQLSVQLYNLVSSATQQQGGDHEGTERRTADVQA